MRSKMVKASGSEGRELGLFEKYLTGWVLLCIVVGLLLGRTFPQLSVVLAELQVAHVSIPIAICLFFMIYSVMVQIDFKKVVEAAKTPKSVVISSSINWGIKPFTKTLLAWLFMMVIFTPFIPGVDAQQYTAGLVLLGVAPCTAMVLMWVYLAKGNQGLNLVMVAVDSIIMVILFAPLAALLLGVAAVPVPIDVIAFSVSVYVGLPLVAGYISRKEMVKRRGMEWFENKFLPIMHRIAVVALLATLIVLFTFQGEVIISQPLIIAMIAVPLAIQFFLIFGIGYAISWFAGLTYEDAVTVALVGCSNHFEVSIAVATMLYGIESGAALATVVGVLIEVPIMLALVRVCLKTGPQLFTPHSKSGGSTALVPSNSQGP